MQNPPVFFNFSHNLGGSGITLGYALPNFVGAIGSALTKFERSAHLTKYFFPPRNTYRKCSNGGWFTYIFTYSIITIYFFASKYQVLSFVFFSLSNFLPFFLFEISWIFSRKSCLYTTYIPLIVLAYWVIIYHLPPFAGIIYCLSETAIEQHSFWEKWAFQRRICWLEVC